MRAAPVWFLALLLSSCALPGVEEARQLETSPTQRYIDVALSCEYADCPVGVVKPAGGVGVRVNTDITPEQEKALNSSIEQWNGACQNHPLSRDRSVATEMLVYFVPEAEMADVLSIYVEGNVGLFTYDWDATNTLTGMTVAIATELEGSELAHFVLEETTQAMGLMNDVDDRRSIFDGGTGRTTTYSDLDLSIIEMHCRSAITPGMLAEDIP